MAKTFIQKARDTIRRRSTRRALGSKKVEIVLDAAWFVPSLAPRSFKQVRLVKDDPFISNQKDMIECFSDCCNRIASAKTLCSTDSEMEKVLSDFKPGEGGSLDARIWGRNEGSALIKAKYEEDDSVIESLEDFNQKFSEVKSEEVRNLCLRAISQGDLAIMQASGAVTPLLKVLLHSPLVQVSPLLMPDKQWCFKKTESQGIKIKMSQSVKCLYSKPNEIDNTSNTKFNIAQEIEITGDCKLKVGDLIISSLETVKSVLEQLPELLQISKTENKDVITLRVKPKTKNADLYYKTLNSLKDYELKKIYKDCILSMPVAQKTNSSSGSASPNVFIRMSNAQLPEPFRDSGHNKNYKVKIKIADEAPKFIFKTCKDNNPYYTLLECAFSTVWNTILPDLTPETTRLIYGDQLKSQSNLRLNSVEEKNLCPVVFQDDTLTESFEVDKIQGIAIKSVPGFVKFSDLSSNSKSFEKLQLVVSELNTINASNFFERLQIYLQSEKKQWSELNLIEKIGALNKALTGSDDAAELYRQLASILVTAFVLEEDDLHLDNIGISISNNAIKVIKIDHDMSFFRDLAAQAAKKPRPKDFFVRGDRFKITKRDLDRFPNLADANPYYWPTKHRWLKGGSPLYNKQERSAFKQLSDNRDFKQGVLDQVIDLVTIDLNDLRKNLQQSIGGQLTEINAILRIMRNRQRSLIPYLQAKQDEAIADKRPESQLPLTSDKKRLVKQVSLDYTLAMADLNKLAGKTIQERLLSIDADWRFSLVEAKKASLAEVNKALQEINTPGELTKLHQFLESKNCNFIRYLRSRLSIVRKNRGLYGLSRTYKKMAKAIAKRAKVLLKETASLTEKDKLQLKKIIHSPNQYGYSFKRQSKSDGSVDQIQNSTKVVITTLEASQYGTESKVNSLHQKNQSSISAQYAEEYLNKLNRLADRARKVENSAMMKRIYKLHELMIEKTGSIAISVKTDEEELSVKLSQAAKNPIKRIMKGDRYVIRKDLSLGGLSSVSTAKNHKLSELDKLYSLTQFAVFMVFDKKYLKESLQSMSLAGNQEFELIGSAMMQDNIIEQSKPMFDYMMKAYARLTKHENKEITVSHKQLASTLTFSAKKSISNQTISPKGEKMVYDILRQMLDVTALPVSSKQVLSSSAASAGLRLVVKQPRG